MKQVTDVQTHANNLKNHVNNLQTRLDKIEKSYVVLDCPAEDRQCNNRIQGNVVASYQSNRPCYRGCQPNEVCSFRGGHEGDRENWKCSTIHWLREH